MKRRYGIQTSFRPQADLIKQTTRYRIKRIRRCYATCCVLRFSFSKQQRPRRVLIGSNPFNSGNEFQWTILIRESPFASRFCSRSLASSALLNLQASRALQARHRDIEQPFTFVP